MTRYRYKGDVEVLVPQLNQIVQPGDEVEAERINNVLFEPIKDKPKTPPKTPAAPPAKES